MFRHAPPHSPLSKNWQSGVHTQPPQFPGWKLLFSGGGGCSDIPPQLPGWKVMVCGDAQTCPHTHRLHYLVFDPKKKTTTPKQKRVVVWWVSNTKKKKKIARAHTPELPRQKLTARDIWRGSRFPFALGTWMKTYGVGVCGGGSGAGYGWGRWVGAGRGGVESWCQGRGKVLRAGFGGEGREVNSWCGGGGSVEGLEGVGTGVVGEGGVEDWLWGGWSGLICVGCGRESRSLGGSGEGVEGQV